MLKIRGQNKAYNCTRKLMVNRFCPLISHFHFITVQAPPKGPNQYYDPNNFDEYFVQDYGGYTLSEGLRGKGGRGSRGGGGGGMGGGGGGGFGGRGGMGGRGG